MPSVSMRNAQDRASAKGERNASAGGGGEDERTVSSSVRAVVVAGEKDARVWTVCPG